MKVSKTEIPDLLIIDPKMFHDEHGYFYENFQQERYREAGLNLAFVQDNISRSKSGVLRGLHYQKKFPQGKLITVLDGSIFDVVVDLRRGSPTFKKWFSIELTAKSGTQLYLPPGLAHGFCVTSSNVLFQYKCTDYYHPEDEYGVRWSDPILAINWPVNIEVILSAKDKALPLLSDCKDENLPIYDLSS